MTKHRIYELARLYGTENKIVIDILQRNNIIVKNHMSSIDDAAKAILDRAFLPHKTSNPAVPAKKEIATASTVHKKVLLPNTKIEQNHKEATSLETKKTETQKPQTERRDTNTRVSTAVNNPVRNRSTQQRDHRGPVAQNKDRSTVVGQTNTTGAAGDKKPTGTRDFKRADNRPINHTAKPVFNRDNATKKDNTVKKETTPNHTPHTSKPGTPVKKTTGDVKKTVFDKNKSGRNDHKSSAPGRKNGVRPHTLLSDVLNKSKKHTKQRGRNNHNFINTSEKKPRIDNTPKLIQLNGPLTVKELSQKMGKEVSEIIKKLMLLGIMANINQEVDLDTATLLAEDFGITVEELPPPEDPTEVKEIIDSPESLILRPPVVTIMGHVDHGKTSLLDAIRQTNVTAREAGGITQHIGAYQIRHHGKKIVFLDTPGHEAFTAMRARGAQVTDIAILVVAADDGVMPQTVEAINHAKSAGVPMIIAINKMDKEGAHPEQVKQQLTEYGIVSEEWGGDTIMVPVSARSKLGLEDLMEDILLVAEVAELKANPNRAAQGVVIEAELDKGRGPVATILVQKGTLRVGDTIIAGTTYGKVRAMINERGEKVKKAEPSTPVEVLGLSDVPAAGDIVDAVDDKIARALSEKRIAKKRTDDLQKTHKVTLDDLFNQIQQGELKELNLVVKGDVQGSVEALCQSLNSIKSDEVRITIVHGGVGAINESDVMLASASNALILGFNVRPDATVRKIAEHENVDLRTYRVIYDVINDVEAAIKGMLAPKYTEVVQGRVEVRKVISTPKAIVAGSYVLEGKITNSSDIRLIRDGIVVQEGKVDALKRFKDDVKEVMEGYECGISIENYRDVKEGDIIEAYTMEVIVPKE
jgi:translation initiation factor IF-2